MVLGSRTAKLGHELFSNELERVFMSVEHHDLVHEFPDLKQRIHELKTSDHHFRRLFDEYHELTTSIENMENEVTPVSSRTEEDAKLRRVQLKDELYRMLVATG